jgi:alpha-mannosidase
MDLVLDETGKPPAIKLSIGTGNDIEVIYCQPVAAEYSDRMFNRPAGWWTMLEFDAYEIKKAIISIEPLQGTLINAQSSPKPMINNGLITIELDPKTGAIVQIKMPHINKGDNLVYGQFNNLIIGYKDDSKEWPAWNLSREYWKYPLNYAQDQNVEISVIDQGPIFATLAIKKTLGNNPIQQYIRLFKEYPIIYCMWCANWQEPHALLKVGLDTLTEATSVITDQMYCALTASTLPTTPADKARYEKVMHKYADLSTPRNEWGITLLNEGKYAFDSSADRIRLTLHRSPTYPGPAGEAFVHQERQQRKTNDGTLPPECGGLGPISCRYAYYPHKFGCLIDSNGKPHNSVKKSAEEFNNPIFVSDYTPQGTLEYPSLEFYVPDNVQITAIKRKEWENTPSLIFRVAEICGQIETHVNLIFPKIFQDQIESIQPVDLMERPIEGAIEWNKENAELKFAIGNFEVVCFELVLKK